MCVKSTQSRARHQPFSLGPGSAQPGAELDCLLGREQHRHDREHQGMRPLVWDRDAGQLGQEAKAQRRGGRWCLGTVLMGRAGLSS